MGCRARSCTCHNWALVVDVNDDWYLFPYMERKVDWLDRRLGGMGCGVCLGIEDTADSERSNWSSRSVSRYIISQYACYRGVRKVYSRDMWFNGVGPSFCNSPCRYFRLEARSQDIYNVTNYLYTLTPLYQSTLSTFCLFHQFPIYLSSKPAHFPSSAVSAGSHSSSIQSYK